jgi:hypothetical protein
MVTPENEQESTIANPSFSTKIMLSRIGIGLLQGVILYFIYQAVGKKFDPQILFACFWLACIIPIIGISSLGHLNKKQICSWLLMLAVITGGLALYAVWRTPGDTGLFYSPLMLAYPITLYIAHTLVLAGALDKSFIASYPTYFAIAWKLLIQFIFSLLFVAALYAVLVLGSTLFALVKLFFLRKLLLESWFVIPTITFAFAYAWHITDVKPGIIKGIRTLLLTLLSWILPIAVLLVTGFLLSLIWTGLDSLWKTRNATLSLLSIAIVLILLINATFQNGRTSATLITQICAKIGACLLLPITGIAIYALALRIGPYGWTDERVIAAAILLIISCYAIGYLWAASQRGIALQGIAKVNIINALIVISVILALLTPLADPKRISVNNQIHRLLTGKISVNDFDFDYLTSEGGRYGSSALAQIKNISDGADASQIRDGAEQALQKSTPQIKNDVALSKQALQRNLTIWPKTMHLPDSFLQQSWIDQFYHVPNCLTTAGSYCDVYLQPNPNGLTTLILVPMEGLAAVFVQVGERWIMQGSLPLEFSQCSAFHKALKAGQFQWIPSTRKDLQIAGQRIELLINNHEIDCP